MQYTFDSREVRPGMGFVALKGEKVDGHDFIDRAKAAGAVEIVDGLSALQEKARQKCRGMKAKIIAVTGSAGKTTTKEFLKTFLACPGTEGNFNNHIGLPMTILNAPDDADFLVLEMGTNHPGEIAALCDIAEPDVGVLVSIGTAHIEFFKTREGIAQEKSEILRRAREFSVAPAACREFACCALPNVEFIDAAEDAGETGDETAAPATSNIKPPTSNLALTCPLPGEHNRMNMLLAYAVARRLGVSAEVCAERLKGFRLPGARWRTAEKWGVTFIDDSYNANPDSMIAALDTFAAMPCEGKRVAVLGDMFELGDNALELHRRVFAHAMALGIELVIGVGEMSSQCLCHLVYKDLRKLKLKFRLDVSAGDLVLIKGSHGMHLSELIA